MNKTVTEIVTDVRTKLNEAADNKSDSVLVTVDDSEMDFLISHCITRAINFVHGNADVALLADSTVKRIDETVAADQEHQGVVRVSMTNATTYMRLIGAKLGSWDAYMPVTEETDADACMQIKAPRSGANWQRPAVIRSREPGNVMTFEFYKAKDATDNGNFSILYVEKAKPFMLGEEQAYYVDDNMYEAITDYITSLALIAYGETAQAKEYGEMAAALMGADVNTDKEVAG